MKSIKKSPKLVPFDAARYLHDEAAIAEYMTVVLETEDPDLLLLALSDIARCPRPKSQAACELISRGSYWGDLRSRRSYG